MHTRTYMNTPTSPAQSFDALNLPHVRLPRLPPTPPGGAPLIGLVGRAGEGKDTVAMHLEDEWAFTHLAFADCLAGMLHALFEHTGIDGAWMVERDLKEQPTALGYSYRHLAQTLGTEWGRGLDAQFWLRATELSITAGGLDGEKLVISDVRFLNEAEWVRARGGVLVRVVRPDALPARDHVSETQQALIECQYTLWNTSTLAALDAQVDRLVNALYGA